MILLFWIAYYFFSLFISILVRNFFKNRILKSFFFGLVLSLFWAFWFLEPGKSDLAPIVSIIFVSLLENGEVNLERLARPFLVFLLGVYLIEIIFSRFKARIG